MLNLSRLSKIFLILILSISFSIFLESTIASTNSNPQKISVVIDNNYPPYTFLDKDGNLQGYLIDLWKLWEEKTGIKVELHGYDWNKALEAMKNGEFDVIDTIFFTPERAKIFDYSKPYEKIDVSIFFHKDLSGISDPRTLFGFVVGVKSGDAAIEYLKKFGITSLKEYPSYESIIEDAKNNKIMVFVIDNPPALYFLHKAGIIENFKHSHPIYSGEFHRAVRKNNKELLKIIEEGFAQISEEELNTLRKKWFGIKPYDIFTPLKYLIIPISFIALFLILLFVWNYSLRKKVRDKTIELEKQISENIEKTNQIALSEKKYRSIFENAVEGIVLTDNDGNILTLNTAFSKMIGYERPEELYGKNIKELYVNQSEIENLIEILKNENFVRGYETRILRKDGSQLVISHSLSTIKDEKGNILNYVLIIEDITEKKEKEEEIRVLREHYYQSQKMESLGTLTGGIAHDFNNFLTAIKGFASLAKMKIKNDTHIEEYLNKIILTSNRMAEMISNLLAFSRKQPIQLKPIDLTKEITFAEPLIRKVFTEKIDIKIIKPDREITVLADKTQIIQILLNLASNSRDAMPEGGFFTIEIEESQIDEDFIRQHRFGRKGEYALLKVSDTGVGMDKDTLNRIFEPFFTTKEFGKGTGLGLSTVYGIVKMHNGFITVKSEIGKGTTFYIYLPKTNNQASELMESQEIEAFNKAETVSKETKIILAEDNEEVREYLKEILSNCGYKILEASNGEELISIFRKNQDVALIISDCIMPKKTGIEAYFTIRDMNQEVKFIFISGYDKEMISKIPPDDRNIKFMPKPLSPDSLLNAIREMTAD